MVYRILLLGGPEDGDQLMAPNPWYRVTTPRGNVYVAERDTSGQPVVEEGDAGEGVIEAVTQDGTYLARVRTIRMVFSHALTGAELAAWKKETEEYNS